MDKIPQESADFAIRFNQATLSWGVVPDEKEDKKDKKKKKKKKVEEEEEKKEETKTEEEKKKEVANMSNVCTLRSLDLKINKGEFVCIVGDVGSGKSSLLSALIGDLLLLEEKEKVKYPADRDFNKEEKERILSYFHS